MAKRSMMASIEWIETRVVFVSVCGPKTFLWWHCYILKRRFRLTMSCCTVKTFTIKSQNCEMEI